MQNFNFSVPQDIIVGAGSIKKLGECATKLGGTHALIISGPHLNKMGLVDTCKQSLADVGIPADAFTETEGNPSVETVEKATKLYKECGADFIVAFGGGSPMDVAKAVGVIAKYGGSITEYEGGGKVPGPIVPQIAIPTTAGTGSEVTAFSVITDHSRNYKLTVFSYELIPKYAILDPDLIATAPASVAAACGMDAFIHACESYISTDASPFSEAMSEKAMELIGRSIRAYVANRTDVDAASDMVFYPQLGVKLCSMAGGGVQKIYMVLLREPSRRDRSGSDLFHLRDGFEIKMNFDRNVSCFIFVNALMHDDFFD